MKLNYGYLRGNVVGGTKSGAWDEHTRTTIYKIDNQQRPTVYLLYSTGNSTQ